MVAIPNETVESRSGPSPFRRLARALANWLPKGLYARSLIIIIAPMVLLQSVVAFVFMERHYELVTRRLSTATTRDIAALIDVYQSYKTDDKKHEQLIRMAHNRLNLSVQILPPQDLPPARAKPFFGLLDRTLSEEIRNRIGKPFWIDTVGRSHLVEIRIKLEDAVFRVLARRSQTYASNSHIFLLWMVGTSLVLLAIAILFLRNQIKPILHLAGAVESFGKGRPAPEEFRPRGAREVRQAAYAFIEMRDRVERQIEQRTTMLAGVSHDLRTILTRFKLQLAMAPNDAGVEGMMTDVDDMHAMLEAYLAFARGDAGEDIVPVDMRTMLKEVRKQAAHNGKAITVRLMSDPIEVPLQRQAFKRAVTNLVNNALRHGEKVRIDVARTKKWLTIRIEDDGPGIPADKREEVFRPFHRLEEGRTMTHGSSGLGLAIARDIIRGHGGDITLADSPLGGLRATIKVPV